MWQNVIVLKVFSLKEKLGVLYVKKFGYDEIALLCDVQGGVRKRCMIEICRKI